MMILLCFLNRMVYKQKKVSTMALYLNLKFKMKLSFQAWQTKKSLKELVI